MPVAEQSPTLELPGPMARALDDFVEAARTAFGEKLRSVVLYGSAAEGRLRASSDLNVILVLSAFDQDRVDRLREPLRVAQAAARLSAMFLLEGEIQAAAEAFAAKFADVLHRRRVLLGPDPFDRVAIPRPAAIFRLKQVLLNTTLRLRAYYAERSLREEQLIRVVAEAAAPLRTAASSLLELEGGVPASPKQALEAVVSSWSELRLSEAVRHLSDARESRPLPPGAAGATLFGLLEVAERLRARTAALR